MPPFETFLNVDKSARLRHFFDVSIDLTVDMLLIINDHKIKNNLDFYST